MSAAPSWCQFVPAQFQSAACRGSNAAGCACSNFCKDTPAESWSNNPECCGCQASQSGTASANDAGSTGTAQPGTGASGRMAAFLGSANLTASASPSWCQFVPAQFQSAACRGSIAAGCACSNFCKDTPAESWSNNPECCGCQALQSETSSARDAGSTGATQPGQ